MIIFFTSCKNFTDDIIWRQTNAILSWKRLKIEKKIVILGNDFGVENFCKKHNLINYTGKKANFSPTLYSMIDYINENKINDDTILCYLNSDIILTEEFSEIIKTINNNPLLESSLIVGMRNEWVTPENLNLDENNSLKLDSKFKNLNNKVDLTAHDYFIFNKNWNFLKKNINEKIGVGEPCYDLFIVGIYLMNNKLIIDATNCINAIHQDHGKFDKKNQKNIFDLKWSENSIKLNLQKENFELKEVQKYLDIFNGEIKNINIKFQNCKSIKKYFLNWYHYEEQKKVQALEKKVGWIEIKKYKKMKILNVFILILILIYFILTTNFINFVMILKFCAVMILKFCAKYEFYICSLLFTFSINKLLKYVINYFLQ